MARGGCPFQSLDVLTCIPVTPRRFETADYALHGLWSVSMVETLDLVAAQVGTGTDDMTT